MANKIWFRCYTEITRDRKLRRLPVAYRWIWIAILAIAKESPCPGKLLLSDNVPVTAEDISDEAAVSVKEVRHALEILSLQFMLVCEDGIYRVLNWDRRQFASDNTTDRWNRWNSQRITNVEPNVEPNVDSAVLSTPPDPDPDPDPDTDQKNKDLEDTLSPPGDGISSIPSTPHQEIVTLYNQNCFSLPKVIDATNGRKDKIRVLWKQHPDINQFLEVFTLAEASEFLSGRDGKWTGCNFDWLIKGANFQKVLEGTYRQREPTKKIPRAYQSLMDYAEGGES